MRYVVTVARERNFTRAAEQLHVAQQALSQQVRAVEKMLGVQLFDRAARPVKLTPAGTVFVQEARRALSASERVLERTRAAARGELGRSAWPTRSPSPTRPCPSLSAHSRKTRPR